jgi:hypothetical protein
VESKWIFAPLQGMNLRIKTIETILLRTARFEQVLEDIWAGLAALRE